MQLPNWPLPASVAYQIVPGEMNRIKHLRESKKLTQAELGELVGTSDATIQRLETGKRKLSAKWMHLLSEALNVSIPELLIELSNPVPVKLQIRGEVRTGAWLEIEDKTADGDLPQIAIMPDDRHPEAAQYALRVVGTSMNKVVQPGDYVIVADWAEVGRDLRDGDLVVIRRQRGSTYEVTLKRARLTRTGWELRPESTDPRHQEPVVWKDGELDVEVQIVGLVLGKYSQV